MAYNDDAVLAKLSALNETQESIVSIFFSSISANESRTNSIFRSLSLNGLCFIGKQIIIISGGFQWTN